MYEPLSLSNALKRIFPTIRRGISAHRILNAENRLHIKLPAILRDYYIQNGAVPLSFSLNRVYPPENLDFSYDMIRDDWQEEGYEGVPDFQGIPDILVFWSENQGVWAAGICREDLSQTDPPVYMSDEDLYTWKPGGKTLSEFLAHNLCWNLNDCKELAVKEMSVEQRNNRFYPQTDFYAAGEAHTVYAADFDHTDQLVYLASVSPAVLEPPVWEGAMTVEKFWRIIELAKEAESSETAEQVTDFLHTLPLTSLLQWKWIFDEYFVLADKNGLWAAAFLINEGCGDDSFAYFRGWLITQGRMIYHKALADPDFLANVWIDKWNAQNEKILSAARSSAVLEWYRSKEWTEWLKNQPDLSADVQESLNALEKAQKSVEDAEQDTGEPGCIEELLNRHMTAINTIGIKVIGPAFDRMMEEVSFQGEARKLSDEIRRGIHYSPDIDRPWDENDDVTLARLLPKLWEIYGDDEKPDHDAPPELVRLIKQGNHYLEQENHTVAFETFLQAKEKYPQFPDGHFGAAFSLQLMQQNSEAVSHYQRAFQRIEAGCRIVTGAVYDYQRRPNYYYGCCLYDAGRIDEAIEALLNGKKQKELYASDTDCLAGIFFLEKGNYQQAAAYFEESLKRFYTTDKSAFSNYSPCDSWNHWGNVCMLMEQYPIALRNHINALDFDTELWSAWKMAGLALQMLGQESLGSEFLAVSEQQDPSNGKVLLERSKIILKRLWEK